jgi:hypothetical protein
MSGTERIVDSAPKRRTSESAFQHHLTALLKLLLGYEES